jgi:signal transduction histidine kinase
VLQRDEVRELIIESPMPVPVATSYFLEEASELELMRQAVRVLLRDDDRVIRVVGRSVRGLGSGIEITVPERPLRTALWDYGRRILLVSLAITLATAALLFFAVRTLIVRPIDRVVAHMMAYRDDPEDARRIIEPSEGARELVEAETALRELQLRLTAALKQKDRLAALGGAVAKISHDLRNMLTTAQLLADRLETSADPAVRRTAPKLVASLSRAVSLCERTMTFGKAEEPAPELADVAFAPLVEEVVEAERLAAGSDRVSFAAEVPPDLRVRADADQLFRVLTNLVRNAGQAIEAAGGQGAVRVSAARDGASTTILVCRHRPWPAAEGAREPLPAVPRRGAAGRGRPRPRHRRRADPRPRRHPRLAETGAEGHDLPHHPAGLSGRHADRPLPSPRPRGNSRAVRTRSSVG